MKYNFIRRSKKIMENKYFGKMFLLGLLVTCISIFNFSSCASSYHIQMFSDDVRALPFQTIEKVNSEGKVTQVTTYEGLFRAKDLETAMHMAEQAGFTKILSVEYGVNWYFIVVGIINPRWVQIRCIKEVEKTTINNNTSNL